MNVLKAFRKNKSILRKIIIKLIQRYIELKIV